MRRVRAGVLKILGEFLAVAIVGGAVGASVAKVLFSQSVPSMAKVFEINRFGADMRCDDESSPELASIAAAERELAESSPRLFGRLWPAKQRLGIQIVHSARFLGSPVG
jgi:hypothetical protein